MQIRAPAESVENISNIGSLRFLMRINKNLQGDNIITISARIFAVDVLPFKQ